MQVDKLAEIGYVLRSLVGNTRDIILVDQQGRRSAIAARHFLNIDYSSISDAPNAVEPGPSLFLHLISSLRLAT